MIRVNGKQYVVETGNGLLLSFTLNPGNSGLEPDNFRAYHPSERVFQGFITLNNLSNHQYQGVNRAIDLYEGKI